MVSPNMASSGKFAAKWVGLRRSLFLALGLPSLGCAVPLGWAAPLDAPLAQHVIHISVDGLGGTYLKEYLELAPTEFPTFQRLRLEGASTFNARCDYSNSLTQPNHASMLTGRPALQQPDSVTFRAPHGLSIDFDPGPPWTLANSGGTNDFYKASVFDVAHDRGLSTTFFSGKQKFDYFLRSYDGTNGAPDLEGVDNGRAKVDCHVIVDWTSAFAVQQNDSNLVTSLIETLVTKAPTYTFLHLADPDITGHYYLWGTEPYRAAVREVDRQLARVLAAVESTAALSNRTAIVLTSDHGGGDSAGWHYYADVLSVYTIPVFVWGPGIPAGREVYELFANRREPGTEYLDYNAPRQPLRNGDTGNMALALLGLPPVPGSCLIPEFKPSLLIQRRAPGIVISWSGNDNPYDLEWADGIPPALWRPWTNRVIQNSGRSWITIDDLPPSRRFFRLNHPGQR